MEEPRENSFMLTVGLGDIRKKHALAISARIEEILRKEFGDKVGSYAVSAHHSKGYWFGWLK